MKIALIGDIGLFGCYNLNMAQDIEHAFASIKAVLNNYDYVIGNLETPLTNYKKNIGGKSAYLKGNPASVAVLKYLGVTHVSLANNHSYDYCVAGVNETKQTLEHAGIVWYGLDGRSVSLAGGQIKLYGSCCWSTNARGMMIPGKNTGVNVFDPHRMQQQLEADRKQGVLGIYSVHFGEEHVHYPNHDHLSIFRQFAAKYHFILHGHHPHVMQGYEKRNKSLLFYSLGNFCFDDVYTPKSKYPLVAMSEANRISCIASLNINGGEVSYSCIPIHNKNGSLAVLHNYVADSDRTLMLDMEKAEYIKMRSAKLATHYANRKKRRTLQWYLKRLNVESVKMLINSKRNKENYIKTVKNYCNDHTN